jgi:hypothetical protein
MKGQDHSAGMVLASADDLKIMKSQPGTILPVEARRSSQIESARRRLCLNVVIVFELRYMQGRHWGHSSTCHQAEAESLMANGDHRVCFRGFSRGKVPCGERSAE